MSHDAKPYFTKREAEVLIFREGGKVRHVCISLEVEAEFGSPKI